MGLYAMTGSATGIGAATRAGLEKQGHRVIGVDIKDAEIVADLCTPEGREAAVREIHIRAPEGLDGLVPCAGVGPQTQPISRVVSLNFYGSVTLAERLKDLLVARRGAAVLISSNSAPLPGLDEDLVQSMLDGDEDRSRARVLELNGHHAYAGSKLALTRWMRRSAVEWAREGVRLNAVAPGATRTPLLQAGLDDPEYGKQIRDFPIPLGDFGRPEQIAAAVLFLLGPEAGFCCGSVFFVDGGSDAMLRPDRF